MFIKSAIFKKLAKAAWRRNGLLVGNTGEDYIISGGTWAVKVKKDCFPKKEKATIIELTGDLPTEGKFFRSNGDGNQYEFGNEFENVVATLSMAADTRYRVTRVATKIEMSNYAVIQNEEDNEVRFVNSIFTGLIDNQEIDEDIEMVADGPLGTALSNVVIWKNEISTVAAVLLTLNEEHKEYEYLINFKRLLENMELQ